jgi:hypothetical protein
MKIIYICGDSFACGDAESSVQPWPDLLQEYLGPDFLIKNLSIVCASNFLIRLQIDHAIENQADFIMMFCTSSTRAQGKLKGEGHGDMLDRFYRIGSNGNEQRDLACYSFFSMDETCVFDQHQIESIQSYHKNVYDLGLAIKENQYMIESSLYRLRASGIPFIWDQGGFENPNFGGPIAQDYFRDFSQWRSEKNIWNISGRTKSHRPYFHIVDQSAHLELARYYRTKIVLQFNAM